MVRRRRRFGNTVAAWAVLSPGEKRHAGRFSFEHDRSIFVASRSLRRHVLSHYADVDPAQWRFTVNPHGRPCVDHPLLDDRYKFNVSKSGGIVVCAVAHGSAVGVHIGSVPAGAIEAVLAPSEIAALQGFPHAEWGKRFCTHWTLKEAYLKARGVGLSVPLDSVVFDVSSEPGQAASLLVDRN